MKIIFHPDFFKSYTFDPAAIRGRLEPAYERLVDLYPMVKPEPCTEEDILLVHTADYLEMVKREMEIYDMAMLAAGASLAAAESACAGEPAFALCRPPGHHASAGSAWGFCTFNNAAVAVSKLLREEKIESALIIDFDLHYGDGTENILQAEVPVTYWQGPDIGGKAYVSAMQGFLSGTSCDMVVVSAGFDRHLEDWGGLLETKDYRDIGEILGQFARDCCEGRLFAVLEGGYNPESMGESIEAFLFGLDL